MCIAGHCLNFTCTLPDASPLPDVNDCHDAVEMALCDHLSPLQYTSLRSRATEMKGNYEELLERERKTGKEGADPQAVSTEVILISWLFVNT